MTTVSLIKCESNTDSVLAVTAAFRIELNRKIL